MEDLLRSGRPSTENIEKKKKKRHESENTVLENRHTSLRELVNDLSIAYGMAHYIAVNILCI